jgi:predicted nicotinamide N-methyase
MTTPAQAQLLARIHRHYRTITEPRQIGPLRLAFTRIEDPDRVLDEVAAAEDRREKTTGQRRPGEALHLPYWAELWDSALGIGQWLMKQGAGTEEQTNIEQRTSSIERPTSNEAFPLGRSISAVRRSSPAANAPLRILDLGCGMGLAGTVAAAVGHRVLFADLEPPALLFARLNSLPFVRYPNQVRTRRLNWQSDTLAERFDLILGADILYERKQWDFLEPFWRSHLAPGGSVLLGEPGRQTGDLFGDWITARHWQLTRLEEPVTTRPRPIRLFQLHPAS